MPTNLTGNTIASTFDQLLHVDDGTTTNDAYYYIDDGTNINLYLYSELTKFMRSVAPTETTRRWRRGEVSLDGITFFAKHEG